MVHVEWVVVVVVVVVLLFTHPAYKKMICPVSALSNRGKTREFLPGCRAVVNRVERGKLLGLLGKNLDIVSADPSNVLANLTITIFRTSWDLRATWYSL